jgi:hypothetical protein
MKKLSTWIVNLVYISSYCLVGLYLIYLFSWFMGWVRDIGGVSHWELIVGCILLPFLSVSGLYCRTRFDLIRMQDGSSGPSRFIWTGLLLMYNPMITYTYFNQIVPLY